MSDERDKGGSQSQKLEPDQVPLRGIHLGRGVPLGLRSRRSSLDTLETNGIGRKVE